MVFALSGTRTHVSLVTVAENWRRFKQQFEIYEIASGWARKDGKVRAMTLLHVVGSEALEVYNTFQWDADDDNKKVDKIMEKFEINCNPRKNLTFERILFFQGINWRVSRLMPT